MHLGETQVSSSSRMSQRDTVTHLVAGGIAGTVGAIVTCPLEVVKTRLQSSTSNFDTTHGYKELGSGHVTCKSVHTHQHRRRLCTGGYQRYSMVAMAHCGVPTKSSRSAPGLVYCLKYIVEREGPRALFKGLGPNLIGVAPSRAIYFCTYAQTKSFFNTIMSPDSPLVHVCSASCAGFVSSTITNPIWFVKTRLQLDHHTKRMSALECVRSIYQQSGFIGFYKGITASYMGISETVVHFVIYEAVKQWLFDYRMRSSNSDVNLKTSRDFLEFMAAGALSKTIASCIAYPHEVARTRLREEGTKYRTFWQTLSTICAEEGPRGMYRGLGTQLVRQIPNTAIMMATYEAVVYLLSQDLAAPSSPTSTPQFYAEAKSKRELA